ncbi:hypothetical protein UB31_12345 [Bradyrhizobium sp. LTSP849]|uniref:hypothetical protein n=1 Tax=unclassified Bradyrhizobium TaxID=2631580 RepID=UPI0005D1AAED|nr:MULTISPECIES: hypothetical protein [unclassified Bradyrhizobium]KJC50622.1 hypothetical protein UB31_12345 [Bradyrhizobium sp. LTSP849]KJC53099.1 hypothetical protein UP06_01310 [Bradyrhizobium sp. LTSP857]
MPDRPALVMTRLGAHSITATSHIVEQLPPPAVLTRDQNDLNRCHLQCLISTNRSFNGTRKLSAHYILNSFQVLLLLIHADLKGLKPALQFHGRAFGTGLGTKFDLDFPVDLKSKQFRRRLIKLRSHSDPFEYGTTCCQSVLVADQDRDTPQRETALTFSEQMLVADNFCPADDRSRFHLVINFEKFRSLTIE